MSYTKIPDSAIDIDSPSATGADTLANLFRLNAIALKAQAEAGHVLITGGYINHSILKLGTVWNPTGLTLVQNFTARAIPTGDETFDLGAIPVLTDTYGVIPFAAYFVDAGPDNDGVFLRAIRATPTNIYAVMYGENMDGAPLAGTYSMRLWRVPVDGKDTPPVTSWQTLADAEIASGAYLTDGLLTKYRNRDEHASELLLAQHDSAGVHKMGWRHLKTSKLIERQAVTADPAGAARQTFACPISASDGYVKQFVEVFSNGAGDTGIDVYFGVIAATNAPVMIVDLVAGGTVTTVYEISVWQLGT